ncbi:polyphosphate polymerase domain-containing protein [candidate division KSB1 bacterium]|nr:polyphosphate polymerase domain-containing protein [candidate division KSB1 bacterium]
MPVRLEYKYLIPNSWLSTMRTELQPYVDLDPYAASFQNGEYVVRSIYLDTPGFECYHTKIDGLKVRKKYRIRGYNSLANGDVIFLEIKRKNVNFVSKNRVPLNYQNLEPFFATHDFAKYILAFSSNGVEKGNAHKFLYYYYRKALRPVVLIIYEREAYLSKFDPSLRLTFDKNLRSQIFPSLDMLFKEEEIKFAMTQHFIFEVKFNHGLPTWLHTLISRYNLQKRALSKYTICLDTHREAISLLPLKVAMNR